MRRRVSDVRKSEFASDVNFLGFVTVREVKLRGKSRGKGDEARGDTKTERGKTGMEGGGTTSGMDKRKEEAER